MHRRGLYDPIEKEPVLSKAVIKTEEHGDCAQSPRHSTLLSKIPFIYAIAIP